MSTTDTSLGRGKRVRGPDGTWVDENILVYKSGPKAGQFVKKDADGIYPPTGRQGGAYYVPNPAFSSAETFQLKAVDNPHFDENEEESETNIKKVTKAEAKQAEAEINELAIHGQAGFVKEGDTYANPDYDPADPESQETITAGAGGHWVTPTELDAAGQVLVDKSREERDRAVSGLGAKQQSRYTGLMDKILMSGGDMGSAERMAKQAERTTGMENQMLGGQYQSQLADIESANLKDQTNWQQNLQGMGMQTDLAQQQYERGVEEFDDKMRQEDEMRQLQLMIANQQAQQQANSARASGWGTMGGMLGMGIGALAGGGPWGMALGQYAGSSLGQGLSGMGGNASYTPMTMPASTQY